jgi:iron-sulfur cluster assembly accessory protein
MSDQEKIQSDLDKFFAEYEQSKQPQTLEEQILRDFHGNAPIIDESVKGQLPTITPKAQIFISENLDNNQYFRFGVSGGGCSGFNYEFDIADEIKEDDVVFSQAPPAVIDKESLTFLYGSEIDLHDKGMNKLLQVNNPGAKASCGCGTSFAFDEDLLDIY